MLLLNHLVARSHLALRSEAGIAAVEAQGERNLSRASSCGRRHRLPSIRSLPPGFPPFCKPRNVRASSFMRLHYIPCCAHRTPQSLVCRAPHELYPPPQHRGPSAGAASCPRMVRATGGHRGGGQTPRLPRSPKSTALPQKHKTQRQKGQETPTQRPRPPAPCRAHRALQPISLHSPSSGFQPGGASPGRAQRGRQGWGLCCPTGGASGTTQRKMASGRGTGHRRRGAGVATPAMEVGWVRQGASLRASRRSCPASAPAHVLRGAAALSLICCRIFFFC